MVNERSQSVGNFILLLLLASVAGPVSAQSGAQDQGQFEILVNGRPVGTEEFTIRQSGVGEGAQFIATGRVQVLLPSGNLDLTTGLRSSGFQAEPVQYELTIAGDAERRIVGTIGSGRFSARIVTPAGEQLREYVASAGATVLDEGVAHHYYFLARRTRSGEVPILIPRENRQTMATVTDRGEEQVNIRGTNITLYHLVIVPDGGDVRHVWVDSLGRVIRVEVPDRNYVALRTEIPR